MAEKLTALSISGPESELDGAIENFVMRSSFRAENAVSFLAAFRRLQPFSDPNPYEALSQELSRLAERLNVTAATPAYGGKTYTEAETTAWLRSLTERLDAREAARRELLEKQKNARDAEQVLEHLAKLPERLDGLAAVRYVHLHYGRVPARRWSDCQAALERRPDALLLELDRSDAWVWCLAAALPEAADRMDVLLSARGFERILPNPAYMVDQTAAELLSGLQKQRAQRQEELAAADRELDGLRAEAAAELPERQAWLAMKNDCFAVHARAGHSHNRFYVAGWVPESEVSVLEREVETIPYFTCTRLETLKQGGEPPSEGKRHQNASAGAGPAGGKRPNGAASAAAGGDGASEPEKELRRGDPKQKMSKNERMTEKMTALAISGPSSELDGAVERFVLDRNFQPENAVSFLAAFRRLTPVAEPNPYESRLAELRKVMERLGVEPRKADFDETAFTAENTDEFLQSITDRLDGLEAEKERLLAADEDEERAEQVLSHMESLPVQMESLADSRYVFLRYGRVPIERWERCAARFAEQPDMFIVPADRDKRWEWCIAASLPEVSDHMDVALSGHGFERIPPNPEYIVKATAVELLSTVRTRHGEQQERLRQVKKELDEAKDRYGGELLARFSWLKVRSACFGVHALAGKSHNRFYLAGWVPSDEAPAFEREVEAVPAFTCTQMADMKLPSEPPVRMRQGKLVSVFSPLLKMYGLPGYGETDPRVFMAITYTLFFGIMFGDAGQGLALAVLGFALYRKNKSWLWRVLGICGCSSIVFGLFYGSVFGFEDLLPWGGFHPLASANIMRVLLGAVAVGVVVLLVCMVFNMANALRKKDVQGAFFSPNGLSGMVFYVSVLAAVVGAYTGRFSLLHGAAPWLCMVLPLLLIWVGEPLGKLLKGDKDWLPKSVGMFLAESFFDVFEAVLGYLSNTLSFLRLGAFAISHAGMMMVVFMLCSSAAATGKIVTIVLGNIFVAGLEAALASIQIIRLEFYEIFGRFNAGQGRPFTPVTVDYK